MTPPTEANLIERSGRELSQAQFPVDQNGGKPGSSDTYQSGSPSGKSLAKANSFVLQSEGVVDFGSVGHVPLLESGRQPNANTSLNQTSSQSLPTPDMQRPNLTLGMNLNRYENLIIYD